MIGRRELAVPAAMVLVAFAASFAMARPSPRESLDGALRLVETDAANTVCLAGQDCLSSAAEHTLLVFFSVSDCPPSLYETALLDEVFRAVPRARLNVVGVAYGMTADEARHFAVASRIHYPLYVHPERLERFVRNPRPRGASRPVQVLVDREGRVVGRWTPRSSVEKMREDVRLIRGRVGA